MIEEKLNLKWLGLQNYHHVWQEMQTFTQHRDEKTIDEIWFLEHEPVFTQGQNGKSEHLLTAGTIPVIQSDRGGQITYHGPGQLMVYTLIDIKRKKLNIRQLVNALELSVIHFLKSQGINARTEEKAPGVYIQINETLHKICSIGLRIKKGCSFHGLALNVDMDLNPFSQINPCGFKNLKMSQLSTFLKEITVIKTAKTLVYFLMSSLQYKTSCWENQIFLELE